MLSKQMWYLLSVCWPVRDIPTNEGTESALFAGEELTQVKATASPWLWCLERNKVSAFVDLYPVPHIYR